jgi:hypothetical protein
MGWSRGFENGREIGYGVDAECDVPGCTAEIDRGLAYRCGGIYAEFEYLPERPVAQPSTDHTRMTLCAYCGETIERRYTEHQQRQQAHHRPQTYTQARELGVAEPTGAWVHLQTGEMRCG